MIAAARDGRSMHRLLVDCFALLPQAPTDENDVPYSWFLHFAPDGIP